MPEDFKAFLAYLKPLLPLMPYKSARDSGTNGHPSAIFERSLGQLDKVLGISILAVLTMQDKEVAWDGAC